MKKRDASEAAADRLEEAGYDSFYLRNDHIYLTVSDDTPLSEIRSIVGRSLRVTWAGAGNTDKDGESTEDIYIERRRRK